MSKYSTQFKLGVVQAYLKLGGLKSRKQTCKAKDKIIADLKADCGV